MIQTPLDFEHLLRKRRSLTRELLAGKDLIPLKVAILGGPATQEIAAWLELFLLDRGIRAEIMQSEYNRYYEDTVLDHSALAAFAPDVTYLHLTSQSILPGLASAATHEEFEAALAGRMGQLRAVWNGVWAAAPCQIIQNTFEPPVLRPLGHLDASSYGGGAHFVSRLNVELADAARTLPRLVLHDLASLAYASGVSQWSSLERWHAYKMPTSVEADVVIGHSLAALIGAMLGRSRKVLVLDLDNTVWGGVIGDDGADRIVIGRETARGEAFTAFQEYCLRLKARGVLLAVCSKNDDEVARRGFSHPDMVLQLGDFVAFRANWEPKSENLRAMARELNLGLDSFVFVDDNPAERHLVSAQLPMVAVPEVGDEVSRYPHILDAARHFEVVALSREDLERTGLYAANAQREATAGAFADYGAYLDSLRMVGEIDAFHATYLDRITQLTNKTNQFNLTTRRYTSAEIAAISEDSWYLTLYGRLSDTFGDNGLVSVIIGRRNGEALHVDLWLMSCRVLKRGMEDAMLDALVARARASGVRRIIGTYIPSGRNGMVADHYEKLGFTAESADTDGVTSWVLSVDMDPAVRNLHIRIVSRD